MNDETIEKRLERLEARMDELSEMVDLIFQTYDAPIDDAPIDDVMDYGL